MDATHIDTFVDALIDDLAACLFRVRMASAGCFICWTVRAACIDEPPLLAVLVAAVTARNLLDHVIAQAVAAAERLGIPARKHLSSGADLLTSLGVAPGAAHRAARVGRAAHTLPALTRAQRLGGIGIEFADAVGKGVTHINNRVPLSEEDRAKRRDQADDPDHRRRRWPRRPARSPSTKPPHSRWRMARFRSPRTPTSTT